MRAKIQIILQYEILIGIFLSHTPPNLGHIGTFSPQNLLISEKHRIFAHNQIKKIDARLQ